MIEVTSDELMDGSVPDIAERILGATHIRKVDDVECMPGDSEGVHVSGVITIANAIEEYTFRFTFYNFDPLWFYGAFFGNNSSKQHLLEYIQDIAVGGLQA